MRRSREGDGVINKLNVDEKEDCFVESDVNWKWDKGCVGDSEVINCDLNI